MATITVCDFKGCKNKPKDDARPEEMLIVVSRKPWKSVTISLTGYGDFCETHFLLIASEAIAEQQNTPKS